MSQRASDYKAIPLCEIHHRTGGIGIALHAGPKMWEKMFGLQSKFLAETLKKLEVV